MDDHKFCILSRIFLSSFECMDYRLDMFDTELENLNLPNFVCCRCWLILTQPSFWLWKSAEISTKIRGRFLISSDTQICCKFANGRLLNTNSLTFKAEIIFKTFLFCLCFEIVSCRMNISGIFRALTHATYLYKFKGARLPMHAMSHHFSIAICIIDYR